jgi:hypothetical protein
VLEDFSPLSSSILFYFGKIEKNSLPEKKNATNTQNSSPIFFKTSL